MVNYDAYLNNGYSKHENAFLEFSYTIKNVGFPEFPNGIKRGDAGQAVAI